MSLFKQVKKLLRKKDIEQLQVQFENGKMAEYDVEKSGGSKALKKELEALDWDSIAQVQFVLADDDEDDSDDDEDDDD